MLNDTDLILPNFYNAAQSGKLLSLAAIENLTTICCENKYTDEQKDLAAAILDLATDNPKIQLTHQILSNILTLTTNKNESLANSALNVIDNTFEKGIKEELYQCPKLLETLHLALQM